jgi:hypothetical protein
MMRDLNLRSKYFTDEVARTLLFYIYLTFYLYYELEVSHRKLVTSGRSRFEMSIRVIVHGLRVTQHILLNISVGSQATSGHHPMPYYKTNTQKKFQMNTIQVAVKHSKEG